MIKAIYHHPCLDGFTAAWVVNFFRSEILYNQDTPIEYLPGRYGDKPYLGELAGHDVLMLDFSYKFDDMMAVLEVANTVEVVDHHESAERELEKVKQAHDPEKHAHLKTHFDMERSGAGLTWDILIGGQRPPLIDYIEDRDLWRFRYTITGNINMALFSMDYSFATWRDLVGPHLDREDQHAICDELDAQGAAVSRKLDKDGREFIEQAAHPVVVGGYVVSAVNLPYFYASHVGGILAKDQPFGVVYFWEGNRWRFSLRSREGGLNVAKIAEQYGGGGHAGAAGFELTPEQAREYAVW